MTTFILYMCRCRWWTSAIANRRQRSRLRRLTAWTFGSGVIAVRHPFGKLGACFGGSFLHRSARAPRSGEEERLNIREKKTETFWKGGCPLCFMEPTDGFEPPTRW